MSDEKLDALAQAKAALADDICDVFVERLRHHHDKPSQCTGPWTRELPYEVRRWAEREGHTSLIVSAQPVEELRKCIRRKGATDDSK